MALNSEHVRKKIEGVQDLPTLPSVVSEIIARSQSPNTNATDIGELIERDQALMSKVLKLVNSAFYGFPGKIKTIQHGVVIIGFNKVKNVVITASVFDMAKGRNPSSLDLPLFWQHCLGTAISAKVVYKRLNPAGEPEDAFVGGLLSSIGKLILDQYLPEEYKNVFAIVKEKRCTIMEAEQEYLGLTYSTVGTWMAENWQLPDILRNAIQFHLTPQDAPKHREMAAAVHFGDILARALCIGNPGDNTLPPIEESLWNAYALTPPFLDESIQQIIAELRKAQEFFTLIEQQDLA